MSADVKKPPTARKTSIRASSKQRPSLISKVQPTLAQIDATEKHEAKLRRMSVRSTFNSEYYRQVSSRRNAYDFGNSRSKGSKAKKKTKTQSNKQSKTPDNQQRKATPGAKPKDPRPASVPLGVPENINRSVSPLLLDANNMSRLSTLSSGGGSRGRVRSAKSGKRRNKDDDKLPVEVVNGKIRPWNLWAHGDKLI